MTCSQLCEICADECGQHPGMVCTECASLCREAQQQCLALLGEAA